MPRPLRIERPGACYHVISRGNARLPIFHDDADKVLLLDRLVHFAELFRVEIRSYCIMINHVHLHLRTREANLGAFMHSFLTSFTCTYNHRHNSFGHVFQGRYKAFLVEDVKPYRSRVTQYIHLNPARIPSLTGKSVRERHDAAIHSRWSSYGQVLGVRPCPSWLDRAAVLKGWGANLAERRKAYRAATETRLRNDESDPAGESAAGVVLGSESFIDRVRRGLNDLKEDLDIRRESSQHRKLFTWQSLENVIQSVSKAYDCPRDDLLRRHHRGCEARQVLLYLAATYCRGRHSLAELGQALGPISLAAVGHARLKMALRMSANPRLKRRVEKVADSVKQSRDKVKLED